MFYIGPSVVSNSESETNQLCDHEEADTRIALHLQDAERNGARDVLVHTVDTDIIIILVGLLANFHPDTNIWVAFGTGKFFRYYHINSIVETLGPEMSKALPFFHALTGCDTTSQFLGKGKKTAWNAWKCFQDATLAFVHIMERPFLPLTLESQPFRILEHFTCILYDKTTQFQSVNEARQDLFSRKSRTMENIPPTQVNKVSICILHIRNDYFNTFISIHFIGSTTAALQQSCVPIQHLDYQLTEAAKCSTSRNIWMERKEWNLDTSMDTLT